MNLRRRVTVGVAGLVLALGGAACGAKASRGIQDAPLGPTDNSAAEVVNFGDYWPNIQTKCSHGTRLFVVARGTGPFVHIVPNDPSCPGATR